MYQTLRIQKESLASVWLREMRTRDNENLVFDNPQKFNISFVDDKVNVTHSVFKILSVTADSEIQAMSDLANEIKSIIHMKSVEGIDKYLNAAGTAIVQSFPRLVLKQPSYPDFLNLESERCDEFHRIIEQLSHLKSAVSVLEGMSVSDRYTREWYMDTFANLWCNDYRAFDFTHLSLTEAVEIVKYITDILNIADRIRDNISIITSNSINTSEMFRTLFINSIAKHVEFGESEVLTITSVTDPTDSVVISDIEEFYNTSAYVYVFIDVACIKQDQTL